MSARYIPYIYCMIKILTTTMLILSLGACSTPRPPKYIIITSAKRIKNATLIKGVKSHTYVYPCTCVKVGDTVRVISTWILMPKF
jgi:hypothetical protein